MELMRVEVKLRNVGDLVCIDNGLCNRDPDRHCKTRFPCRNENPSNVIRAEGVNELGKQIAFVDFSNPAGEGFQLSITRKIRCISLLNEKLFQFQLFVTTEKEHQLGTRILNRQSFAIHVILNELATSAVLALAPKRLILKLNLDAAH